MNKAFSQSGSLREHVYSALRTGLRHGGIGRQSTATERDLAEELGVSRTPIREALALLVHDGLIVQTTKGFALPNLTNDDVADIFELRHLIEPFAMVSALDRMSRADLKQLRKTLDDQIAAHATQDSPAFSEANRAFREVWTARIANARIRDVIERYDSHIVAVRETTLSDPANRAVVIAGLAEILRAIEAEDAPAAERAAKDHLVAAELALTQTLGKGRT